jgi:hypothetical protein
LKRSRAYTIWAASLISTLIVAATNWQSVLLTEEVGGAEIAVSGFDTLPILSALLLLQGSAIFVGILTRQMVGRVLAGVMAAVMLWQLVSFFLEVTTALGVATERKITELTGIAGLASQQEIVLQAEQGLGYSLYPIAVIFNFLILVFIASKEFETPNRTPRSEAPIDSLDLWDEQNR